MLGDPGKPLSLRVFIDDKGFSISASGGVLGPGCGALGGGVTLPKVGARSVNGSRAPRARANLPRTMRALSMTDAEHLPAALRAEGWAVMRPYAVLAWLDTSPAELEPLRATWHDLPADIHLRDGGHYRFRRHGCFLVDPVGRSATLAPPRAHWQPLEYNALHGGIERWFEPIAPGAAHHPVWTRLLVQLGVALARLTPVPLWYVEAHQFRVDTTGGIGRPTPEGAHRDGVDFVAVVMLGRAGIKGGETRVFQADGPSGVRFTLEEPWSALVFDDRRVIHETTPIQPIGEHGYRDTLVLTYRSGGFQGPDAAST